MIAKKALTLGPDSFFIYKSIRQVFLPDPKQSCVQQTSLKPAGVCSKRRFYLLDTIWVVFPFWKNIKRENSRRYKVGSNPGTASVQFLQMHFLHRFWAWGWKSRLFPQISSAVPSLCPFRCTLVAWIKEGGLAPRITRKTRLGLLYLRLMLSSGVYET